MKKAIKQAIAMGEDQEMIKAEDEFKSLARKLSFGAKNPRQ